MVQPSAVADGRWASLLLIVRLSYNQGHHKAARWARPPGPAGRRETTETERRIADQASFSAPSLGVYGQFPAWPVAKWHTSGLSRCTAALPTEIRHNRIHRPDGNR